MLVDGAAAVLDDAVDELRVAAHQIAQLLRVQGLRQRGKSAQIGEQDGDLAPFTRRSGSAGRRRRGRQRGPRGNGGQQPFAVTERCDSELFEVGVGKLRENRDIDVVVGKCRRILLEPERFQPRCNVHIAACPDIPPRHGSSVADARAQAASRAA